LSEVIATKTGTLLAKFDVSAEKVLAEMGKIAFTDPCKDPCKLFNADGSPKDLKDLDEDTAAAISAFDVVELGDASRDDQKLAFSRVRKIKLADKLKALELLARYHKLLTDKVENSGRTTLEMLVCNSVSD